MMVRVPKEEWNITLKNIENKGLITRVGGGGLSGNYSVWIEDKKIAHHQFEYENYFEIDEEYYEKFKS